LILALVVVGSLVWFIWRGLKPPDASKGSDVVLDTVATYTEALGLAETGELAGAGEAMADWPRWILRVEAHWWMARDLLRLDSPEEDRVVNPETLELARGHLERVVRDDRENGETPVLLAPVLLVASEGNSLGRWMRKSGGGWLVTPGDVRGLHESVEEALDPAGRAKRGRLGHAFAAANFDREANCSQIFEKIAEI
ncbi:MAG: glycosyltransferase, partial [Verrucomicrobiales bacterium]